MNICFWSNLNGPQDIPIWLLTINEISFKQGTKFVEDRRKVLQEYIRHVVNLIISTQPELATNTCKATLLDTMPFFG
jgi:bifunctional pyridoxal-dependent enzyme with beta-cystathionase and maltose regulon repressor activities